MASRTDRQAASWSFLSKLISTRIRSSGSGSPFQGSRSISSAAASTYPRAITRSSRIAARLRLFGGSSPPGATALLSKRRRVRPCRVGESVGCSNGSAAITKAFCVPCQSVSGKAPSEVGSEPAQEGSTGASGMAWTPGGSAWVVPGAGALGTTGVGGGCTNRTGGPTCAAALALSDAAISSASSARGRSPRKARIGQHPLDRLLGCRNIVERQPSEAAGDGEHHHRQRDQDDFAHLLL